MGNIGKQVDWLINKLSFLQKFILLFICGVVIPMVMQNLLYYWQTEKNIQEEMLDKIMEGSGKYLFLPEIRDSR